MSDPNQDNLPTEAESDTLVHTFPFTLRGSDPFAVARVLDFACSIPILVALLLMDPKFHLSTTGVGEAGITVLEEESVLNMSVVVSLREEHFEKLLLKLKVGEHATLLKLWDTKLTNASRE